MHAELDTDDFGELCKWITKRIGAYRRTEITIVCRRALYRATLVGDAASDASATRCDTSDD